MGSTALSPAARRWRRSWTWCSDWRTATAASLYSTRPATGKELIGHERGAFTGAFTRKTGLFEAAQGGTVFLDEIAILSVDFQGKLLRVIQERQLRRVGGTEILDIDMRLLSATNEDLDKAMVEGRFRQDLFYRLNVLTITLAALWERDGHVPLLAEHFVKELNQRASRKVDGIFPEAMQVLRRYEWPGNVRELLNVMERACSLTRSEKIERRDLPEHVSGVQIVNVNRSPEPEESSVEPALDQAFKDAKEAWNSQFERAYLAEIISRNDGNITRAAKDAGLDRKHLRRLLKKHDLHDSDS